jgi:hypothetical protein
MSDGPHRSLPMRAAWRRVAERGDNHAYTQDEVSAAMAPALEQDCRADITPEFIRNVRAAFKERDTSLFKDDITPHIDALRSHAGSGMDRAVLDNVCAISATEAQGIDVLLEATKAALLDRAARGARQVEEHYLRRSNAPRAADVRARLEGAIDGTDLEAIASRILNLDPRRPPPAPLKQSGLDDGVKLP